MKHLLPLAWLLSCISAWDAGPAGAAQGPICARDEVVARVAQEIRWRAPYATLLPQTIAEHPGPDRDVVLCAVTVVDRDYDSVRYHRESWSETQQYSVRRLRAGYEVTMGLQH
jgi:hypothetical protein